MIRAILIPASWMLLAAIAAAGAACSPTKTAAEPEPFIRSYHAGTYQQAYDQAEQAHARSDGIAKDRAALMAGLSAYALRRPEQAEKWLIPILTHKDADISGRANWTLGLISADRGNPSRAATLGQSAAEKLQGDDAARARVLAGESLARLGRTAESREQFSQALATATDPGLKASIQGRLASGTLTTQTNTVVTGSGVQSVPSLPPAQAGQFVIQLGAFATPAKAEQVASGAASAAARAGLPSPRVYSTTDPKTGKPLYAAQIGPFPDRAVAEAGLRRMGVQGTVMRAHR